MTIPRSVTRIGKDAFWGAGCEKQVKRDYPHLLYRNAAEQGDAAAQYTLGYCYFNGHGVEKDRHEAVKWYRKAAEQGDVAAQCNLGYCYFNGQGVEKDIHEAVKWYRKAGKKYFFC